MAIAEHVRDELGDGRAAARADEPACRPSSGCRTSARRRAPLPARRADRARPGLRAHRLLLRARHPRRDPRRARGPVPAVDLDGLRRRTRAHMGRCQGFFCGAELAAAARRERASGAVTVVVVGGGPAGLAAALELRAARRARVLVLEREARAGRDPAPRSPPGLRAARPAPPRSGPAYARRYASARRTPASSCGPRPWSPAGARRAARAHRPARTRVDPARRHRSSPPAAASARARRGSCRAPARRA